MEKVKFNNYELDTQCVEATPLTHIITFEKRDLLALLGVLL